MVFIIEKERFTKALDDIESYHLSLSTEWIEILLMPVIRNYTNSLLLKADDINSKNNFSETKLFLLLSWSSYNSSIISFIIRKIESHRMGGERVNY